MLSETKSYPVPHVGQTTWRWKVSGGDRVDDTGKSGLHSAVGAARRRGAGSRNKSATHAPTMPYAGGAIRNPATNPPIGEKRNETPAISRRTSTTTTLMINPCWKYTHKPPLTGNQSRRLTIALANPARSTRRPIAIARPTRNQSEGETPPRRAIRGLTPGTRERRESRRRT